MSRANERLLREALGTDDVRFREGTRFDVPHDGVILPVDVPASLGAAQIVPLGFPTIPTDGFELQLRGPAILRTAQVTYDTPRYHARIRDAVGFPLYQLDSNDPGLSQAWFDDPAKHALVQAIAVERLAGRPGEIDVRLTGIAVDHEADRFRINTPAIGDALGIVIRAGLALADRPRRLAAELRAELARLGVELRGDVWRFDDRCAAVFQRGAATVQLDWRRLLPGERPRHARMRTRLRAHGPDAPAAIDAAWLAPRLAQHAPLVAAAHFASITAARGEVTLLYNGLVRDVKHLAPALELLCRLVAPPPSAMPLR